VDNFGRTMAIVISIGLGIMAIGSTLVYLVLRAFGESHRGGKRHFVLLGVLLAFIFLSIAAILYFT
jgi:hypothetical protein